MSTPSKIRVGFIGAGSICRSRHLPGLAKIDDVDVVAVANRTRESGSRIAAEFDIPDVMDDWQSLIARDDIDAVFIGTWPYMHREMSIAVLEAGKHCFCQARMAMNLAEACDMVAVADANPKLVNMICPPPTRMPFEPFIKAVIAGNKLGQITAVQLISRNGANLSRDKVTWRERVDLSGRQILGMGIFAETLNAILGPYATLNANLHTPIASKTNEQGQSEDIGIPQVVSISGTLENGALIQENHSGVVVDETTAANELIIWGLEGTLRYTFGNTIEMATPGKPLAPVDVPAEMQRDWLVEADFIDAVRKANAGESWHVSPDFHEGLLYMQKVEAVHLAAESGNTINPADL